MTEQPIDARRAPSITGVLLLRTKGNRDDRDFARASMLFDSLVRFAASDLFDRFLVIVPSDEVAIVRERLQPWSAIALDVVDEAEIEPALQRLPGVSGWTRQQLLKLSVSRIIETAFYLTFDADVLGTRPIERDLLLPTGRGLLQLASKHEVPNRDFWWRASARILRLSPKLDAPGMTPTPAVLATEVSRDLLARLGRQLGPEWVEILVRPLRDQAWQQYVPWYRRLYRWTEYSLYYLHCRDAGCFDDFHIIAGTEETPQLLLSDSSIWANEDFNFFDAGVVFSDQDPALFCVVQSAMEIDPSLLRTQIDPYLRAD